MVNLFINLFINYLEKKIQSINKNLNIWSNNLLYMMTWL